MNFCFIDVCHYVKVTFRFFLLYVCVREGGVSVFSTSQSYRNAMMAARDTGRLYTEEYTVSHFIFKSLTVLDDFSPETQEV